MSSATPESGSRGWRPHDCAKSSTAPGARDRARTSSSSSRSVPEDGRRPVEVGGRCDRFSLSWDRWRSAATASSWRWPLSAPGWSCATNSHGGPGAGTPRVASSSRPGSAGLWVRVCTGWWRTRTVRTPAMSFREPGSRGTGVCSAVASLYCWRPVAPGSVSPTCWGRPRPAWRWAMRSGASPASSPGMAPTGCAAACRGRCPTPMARCRRPTAFTDSGLQDAHRPARLWAALAVARPASGDAAVWPLPGARGRRAVPR